MADPFREIWRPHRYKVFYGGRGSGKSWAVAQALMVMCDMANIRILCCREIQNSIKDSSYQILRDTAERLGISGRFSFLESEIRHKLTGSRFIFKGLLRNEQSVKSTEGIDICWVEEAQTVSESSWEVLIPTVRKQGSEIWVTFNPLNADDPTTKRFIENPPPEAYVRKINFDENPHFPPELRAEMEHDKAVDFEKYLHIWEGFPRTVSDAQVFKGRYSVESFPDDLWKKADRLFFGADFGFARDPNTLIRCFMYDGKLYIDYEAYAVGVEIDELPAFYRTVPEVDNWPIHADAARPETISYLANRANPPFRISAASKWQGSIEDGVAYLKSFEKIIIHPRCKHTADEFRLYSYKVDKTTGEVLSVFVDKNNHCIAEGTLITTLDGLKPIEDVTTEDYVLTRDGYKRVLACAITGANREVVEISTDYNTLRCTPEHRVYTINRGFIEAETLNVGDLLLCQRSKEFSRKDTGGIAIQIPQGEATGFISSAQLRAALFGCIDTFGKRFMERFRAVFTSITKTAIRPTTGLRTLNVCPHPVTVGSTHFRGRGMNRRFDFWMKSGTQQKSGTPPQREESGTDNMQLLASLGTLIWKKSSVLNAVGDLSQKQSMTNSVQMPVSPHGEEIAVSTTLNMFASGAEKLSRAINTQNNDFAPSFVRRVTRARSREKRVYDITVDELPEFFANGVLVHNCIDGIRYALDGYITKPGLSKWARLAQ